MTLDAIRSVWLAARPKTLPAAVVPVWTGSLLAYQLGGVFHLGNFVATLIGAVAIQIATNGFNDVIDARKGADTSRRLGPVRVTASGLLSPKAVIACSCSFLLVAVVCGWWLFQSCGWPIVAIGIPSLFLAYGYTGGPVPLAYRGLGELFVLIFFGWVAVCGSVFTQSQQWPLEAWLLGTQVGLLSTVLISINNLRDREEDAGTGKRTLAVRWGLRRARGLLAAEILLPGLIGLLWIPLNRPSWALAGLVSLCPGWMILRGIITHQPGPVYNRWLAVAGLQLVGFAVLLTLLAWR